MSDICLFAGSSNPALCRAIAGELNVELGKVKLAKFSDGEVSVDIKENIRGKDVFIVQSTCKPPNFHLMEMLLMADAARRASATRITAVIPYFGYARQDRRPRSQRVPISARVMADMISQAGVNRVLTVDLHADQIQGFFHIPVDNVYSTRIQVEDLRAVAPRKAIVVSPDIGGVLRARAFARMFNDSNLAIIDKRRSASNHSEVMNIIGDVHDCTCVIVDDIVDTAGTLCNAAEVLKDNGARKVLAYIVHPVLSGRAVETIDQSQLDSLVVTNTIALDEDATACAKISQLSLAEMLAESVRRVNREASLMALF